MSDSRPSYLGLARHYDAHGWDWYARVYGPRLVALLRERGMDRCRVFDAGCGTGTMALLLAAEGFAVTGMDLSEAMLEVARGKDPGGTVRWRRGDLTRLPGGEEFDAVAAVGDVFNHLESLGEWDEAFRGVFRLLRPGGAFFFDVMTIHGLSQLDLQTIQEKDGRTLLATTVWEPQSRRSTLKVTSFLPVPETGLWDRASETIPEWGHPVRAILETLARAGFPGAERVFASEADPEKEERLAVLALRP